MKSMIIAILCVVSCSSLATETCVTVGSLRGYQACAKNIQKTSNGIILNAPTLEGYDLKPKRVFKEEICHAFGGTYLSHKSKASSKTRAIAIKWLSEENDMEIEAPFGFSFMRKKIMTQLTCKLD